MKEIVITIDEFVKKFNVSKQLEDWLYAHLVKECGGCVPIFQRNDFVRTWCDLAQILRVCELWPIIDRNTDCVIFIKPGSHAMISAILYAHKHNSTNMLQYHQLAEEFLSSSQGYYLSSSESGSVWIGGEDLILDAVDKKITGKRPMRQKF
ncbi:MAG: hypothetical protein ACKUBY_03665 [Candidatus Moraniibacteriota bacterium]|jgi:hypothetical protein